MLEVYSSTNASWYGTTTTINWVDAGCQRLVDFLAIHNGVEIASFVLSGISLV